MQKVQINLVIADSSIIHAIQMESFTSMDWNQVCFSGSWNTWHGALWENTKHCNLYGYYGNRSVAMIT